MSITLVQYYFYNMSSKVWTLNLPQHMHEIVANCLEPNQRTYHLLNVKDKFNKSFKHLIEFNERRHVTLLKSDVRVCCAVYFTNTSHPSNFLYGASLVTVDDVRRRFHYSAICKCS